MNRSNASSAATTRKGPARPLKAADGRPTEGHGTKTEAVRERAILALLSERTIALAAKRAQVGERTLRRWMTQDVAFQQELAAARRAAFEDGIVRIQALTTRAVSTLEDLLNAKGSPAVRLGAARTILELGTNRHEAETIRKKLEELEALQRECTGSGGATCRG